MSAVFALENLTTLGSIVVSSLANVSYFVAPYSLTLIPFRVRSFSKQHQHTEAVPKSKPGQNKRSKLAEES